MAQFEFRDLELDRQQIRLFHLQPGEFHDPISGMLSIAYLEDGPKYEALSYVWGDPNVCMNISLDGHDVPVTTNLWAALRRCKSQAVVIPSYPLMLTMYDPVRGPCEERVLWIDALCINQANNIEKTHQVELMTEIYKSTWRGIVWLGDFEDDAVVKPGTNLTSYRDFGLTMDKDLAKMAFQFLERLSKLSVNGHFTTETENVQAGWVAIMEPEVTAFQKLVSLEWFTRIWTVQEFVLPPRVELALGDITCEQAFDLLISKPASEILKHYHWDVGCCRAVEAKVPNLLASLTDLLECLHSTRSMRRFFPIHVRYAIPYFQNRYCADPRDKLFGLLGLAHPNARQLVNYTLDKKQVYAELVRYRLRSEGSLQPLMRLTERDRDTSLPSWVPDLEGAVFRDPPHDVSSTELNYIAHYAPLFSTGTRRTMELGIGTEDELRLGGRRVGSVRHICKGPSRSLWQDSGSRQFKQQLRESWRALLDADATLDWSSYPGGGTYTEAFWRTRTCDVDVSRNSNYRARRVTVDDEETMKNYLDLGGVGRGITLLTTFFITHQGYIGVGPEDTRVGDAVYVLFGGSVPFLLRETPESQDRRGTHTYVGHTYVHGIMDGEVLEQDIPDEQVILV